MEILILQFSNSYVKTRNFKKMLFWELRVFNVANYILIQSKLVVSRLLEFLENNYSTETIWVDQKWRKSPVWLKIVLKWHFVTFAIFTCWTKRMVNSKKLSPSTFWKS